MNNTNPCKEMTWADVIPHMYGPDLEKESINELEEKIMLVKLDSKDETLAAVRNKLYITGSMGEDGNLSFSKNPVLHNSAQSARNECARLAALYTDKIFIAVQLYGAVGTVLKPSIVHV